MPKYNWPAYAIVELLIRLEKHNSLIGYKNHSGYDNGVIVTTSCGSITFSESLVTTQFESPGSVTDELASTAILFRTAI